MTTNILSPKWAGETAAPIDPEQIRFVAAPAPKFGECDGCIFVSQKATVCDRAAAIAIAAGQSDCDHALPGRRSLIYVLDKSDPRQLTLAEKEH